MTVPTNKEEGKIRARKRDEQTSKQREKERAGHTFKNVLELSLFHSWIKIPANHLPWNEWAQKNKIPSWWKKKYTKQWKYGKMLKSKYLRSIYVAVPEYKSCLFPTTHEKLTERCQNTYSVVDNHSKCAHSENSLKLMAEFFFNCAALPLRVQTAVYFTLPLVRNAISFT